MIPCVSSLFVSPQICIWQLGTGSLQCVLSYHPSGIKALSFSADDSWLVSLGDHAEKSVVMWDLQAAEPAAMGRTNGV